MKVYSFGAEHALVILLLPGTCCHWKGNFGRVIPLLADSYRVLYISYDGFDETEHTEFPTILEETEKIESYIQEHCGGHFRASYGCSLGGSFVGLLAACTAGKEEEASRDVVRFEVENARQKSFFDYFERVDLIPLETTDSSVVADYPQRIELYRDTLLVLFPGS